jgi:hypothetical protein
MRFDEHWTPCEAAPWRKDAETLRRLDDAVRFARDEKWSRQLKAEARQAKIGRARWNAGEDVPPPVGRTAIPFAFAGDDE